MPCEIRELREQDIKPAMALVKRVFDEFEAPDYTPEGVREFYDYIQTEAVIDAMRSNNMKLWGGFDGGTLLGVAASRPADHLSLLFVDKRHHRRGVARALLDAALAHCRSQGGGRMTVNAGPYAQEAYRRMGFVETGPARTVNGITFIPMRRDRVDNNLEGA